MRKLLLWAMLTLCLCSPALAEPAPSEDFLGFGLMKFLSADQPVILRADGEPYYDNVTKFIAKDMQFAARLKDSSSYDYDNMPYGTLTDMASGLPYMLMPYEKRGDYYIYNLRYTSIESLVGKRVMWNVFTSPDVLAGAATIPELSTISREIADDEIMPYVRLNLDADVPNMIGRVDIYFVKNSAKSTPVALGDSPVKVYVNRNTYYGYSDRELDFDFSKPVRKSFTLNQSTHYLNNITVEYEKDGCYYTWSFVPRFEYTSIEWGKLALDEQPLNITAGQTVDIEVKLPAAVKLTSDNINITAGNSALLGVSAIDFTQGTASWDGLTYNEEKSELTFTLSGVAAGRTTLCLELGSIGNYYREIHVVDSSGSMNIANSSSTNGLAITAGSYSFSARYVNGKPYYPSAVNDETRFKLSGSGSYPSHGYLGVSNATTSKVIALFDGLNLTDQGVTFNTADSNDCYEYAGLNVDPENTDGYNVWVEFPDDSSLNVVSASLGAMLSVDAPADFAPYFEVKLDDDLNVVSLDWAFVDPSTGEKVTPNVSEIYLFSDYVPGQELTGTSGTISFVDYWSDSNIHFSYTYNGVNYNWNFSPMSSYYYTAYVSIPSEIQVGSSLDATIELYNSADIEAVDVLIWYEDILSADPASFAPDDTLSFDITGLKEGRTRLTAVFTLKEASSSFDKYVQDYSYVRVIGDSSATTDFVSGDLSLHVSIYGGAIVAEGVPTYGDMNYSFEFVRSPDLVPSSYYDTNSEKFIGELHFYSNDQEVLVQDFAPDSSPYPGDSVIVRYNGIDSYYASLADRVEWKFSDDVNLPGSADIAAVQLPNFRPYVKLNRDGINARNVEWYFVDDSGATIDTPSSLEDVHIYVETYDYNSFSSSDVSGSLELNIPEIFIRSVSVSFTSGDIYYDWHFEPVDHPYVWSYDSDYVINWDVASPDLPLVMTVGDTKTLTLSAPNIESPSALIGNSELVGLETVSSTDTDITVKLTAKAAGMTTITLRNDSQLSWPREIWIADSEGKVPGLTDDINALVAELTDETSSGWVSYNTSDDENASEPESDSSKYSTGEPVNVLNGLSVYPRFVMPTDPSPDAYNAVWDEVEENNLSYAVRMFEGEVDVLASRDARASFLALSNDLFNRFPPQLLAIVLPEISVQDSGLYTFRVPTDHITTSGAQLFMHANPSYYEVNAPDHVSLEYNANLEVFSDKYSVTVSVDENSAGEALLIITSRDIHIPTGIMAYTVEDTDVGGNISRFRLYGQVKRAQLNSSDNAEVWITAHTPDGESSSFGWPVSLQDDTPMTFYDDDGNELTSLNGEKFINVSVYLEAGPTYAPYVTVKATQNDISLLKRILPTTDFTIKASSTDLTVLAGQSVNVTLTPLNAVGNVSYSVSDSWVSISGNVATIAPLRNVLNGLHVVNIIGADSDNHTAEVNLNVTVMGGAKRTPTEPGAGEGGSGTSTPTTTPTSPDVPGPAPASQDVPGPAPTSPDVPGDNNENVVPNDEPSTPDDSNNGDNGDNGNTDNGETNEPSGPISVEPEMTNLDLEDSYIVSQILGLLSAFFTGDVNIVDLPDSALGLTRSIEDVTDEELAAIPSNQTLVMILPTIVVPQTAVYVFALDLSSLTPGTRIFLHLMRSGATASSLRASADGDEPYVFLDDWGEQTDTVPDNGSVNVAAYLEAGETYSPMLTTLKEGATEDDGNGDNGYTPLPEPQDQTDEDNDVGSSGGGCSSGFTLASFALVALLVLRRKA